MKDNNQLELFEIFNLKSLQLTSEFLGVEMKQWFSIGREITLY